jgi:transposase
VLLFRSSGHEEPLCRDDSLVALGGARILSVTGEAVRLHSEVSFAALCGVSPLEASSGRNTRRRLNRGGDRQANAALYRIA